MADNVQRLANIIRKLLENNDDDAPNTTARPATFHDGDIPTVKIDGYSYPCTTASLDLNLVDGCRVMVIPSYDENTMVIVGGGLP